MALLIALLLMLALLSLRKVAKRKQESKHKYPRCLPSLPIIGSLLHFVRDPQLHLLFSRLQQKYGSLYSFYMGSNYVVMVNNYQHAKEVLHKKGKIFGGRPHTVTTDLLTLNGKDIAFASYSPLWKMQRKLVHSALHMFGEGTLALEKIICTEASSLCENLAAAQDSPLNLGTELTCSVTNVVCSLCFNSSYKRGDPELENVLKYSKGIVDTTFKHSLVDIFPWLQETFNNDSINDLMDVLLKAKLNTENNNSHLLPGLELTDDYLLMTVADIFGAGVETTATVLKWSILYLLHYPEVTLHYPNMAQPTSDRQHLPYLEATISEVLRIQPVAPLLIPHEALEDTSIGEYIIPKGTHVIINLWSIHHDEKEWDKPKEFNPGRFLDEDGNRIYSPSPSYFPFGAGIRVCLGEALAKMELFLFLAWTLQRFTLSVPEGHVLPEPVGKFGVVLQAPEFKVKVTLREAWKEK
uniref:Steroid 17-alpha-hydroxylase/17,20 lyase n=1 Tax=Varanus komodoensis TaxID=61221 RepID=A0A8D2Q6C3_VARKO